MRQPVSAVDGLREELEALDRRGLFFEVHMRGLAAFRLGHRPAELGLDPDRGWNLSAYRLLLPRDLFRRVRAAEARARRALDRHSLALAGRRFVPDRALPAFIEAFDAAARDLEAAKTQILDRLPELRAQAAEKLARAARRAWPRVRGEYPDYQAFRDRLVAAAQKALSPPTVAALTLERLAFPPSQLLAPAHLEALAELAGGLAGVARSLAEAEKARLEAEALRLRREELARTARALARAEAGLFAQYLAAQRELIARGARELARSVAANPAPNPRTLRAARQYLETISRLCELDLLDLEAEVDRLRAALQAARPAGPRGRQPAPAGAAAQALAEALMALARRAESHTRGEAIL